MSAGRDFELIWNSLPNPALAVDGAGAIAAVNGAAENFLAASERQLLGQALAALAGEDSRLADLVRQARREATIMAEYGVELAWPGLPTRLVDLQAAPMGEGEGGVVAGAVVVIHPRAIVETMDRSLTHRSAARSVAGMAQMLAHEIKNPLAGISGAAQLLQMGASGEERELTGLIRDEVERIGALVGRVEQFGEFGPGRFQAVNIHDVLDRACRSAKAGFAAHARFAQDYDPSLPPTLGDADQLIQVMLNLLKNAAEAVPRVGGIISVRTAYHAGMKVATPAGRRESLPLQVTIADNGRGVPEDVLPHIFEPFVTTKGNGGGLGLALVSKIVSDHGGVISCDSQPGATRFRLLLPMAAGARAEGAEDAA
ncbi:MAG TPA: ATP-binding protein [Thermohalobaculum sp.]|nr:ATP-binding protein [Thermohalobaculum sp.]